MSRAWWAFFGACLIAAPRLSRAQQGGGAVVQVRVVDSASVPVPGADVAIVRGLRDAIAQGVTDSAGRHTFHIAVAGASYEVVVRKIGFARGDQFFATQPGDSLSLTLRLQRVVRTLDPVTVTAEEDLKRQIYRIDADQIAESDRPIFNAFEVMSKLRPDMIYPRMISGYDPCGLFYVWVNGERIDYAPTNDMAMAHRPAPPPPRMGVPRDALVDTKSAAIGPQTLPPSTLLKSVSANVWSVMWSIQAEHIDEITFHDCNDFSIQAKGGRNAVFVTLKPGIAFEPGIGSYVAEPAVAQAANRARAVSAGSTAAIAAYRLRVLGVYDVTTGEPVPDAQITDLATGTIAKTTVTGTISLAFLPEGKSSLRVHKTGYSDMTLDVSISPQDTVPITLLLTAPK